MTGNVRKDDLENGNQVFSGAASAPSIAEPTWYSDKLGNIRNRHSNVALLTSEIVAKLNAHEALVEALTLAIEFDAWRVTAKANRCVPTKREVNERWASIKSMGRAALAKAQSK